MPANGFRVISVTFVAILGTCCCAHSPRAGRDALYEAPDVSALHSLDNASLASRFFQACQPLNHPNARAGDELSSIEAELGQRGSARLSQLRRLHGPINAKLLPDHELLVLLYGIRHQKLVQHSGGCEPSCTSILHAVLARGGMWDHPAKTFEWRGLTGLTDQRLRELWDLIEAGLPTSFDQHREALLVEISHRGGKDWEQFLQDRLQAVRSERSATRGWMDHRNSLDLLTTLRRIQKRPDPVVVQIAEPLQQVVEFPQRPILNVALFNQDDEDVQIQLGGNYRSGRQTRWRIEAVDEDGEEMPIWKPAPGGVIEGGLFGRGTLPPHGTWKTNLSAGSYLPALPVGQYTVRVLYHDTKLIAYDTNVSDLILCSSPPIHLTVKPLRVALSAADDAEIKSDVRRIEDTPAKIIVHGYGEWAHRFVRPDSGRGRILSKGMRAVPVLLDMLRERELSVKQRAEILCLLFSLTGENDPRYVSGPVIGAYEAAQKPRSDVREGRVIEAELLRVETVPDRAVDVAEQESFAWRWRAWRRSFQIER
jgi:hypothetical protein